MKSIDYFVLGFNLQIIATLFINMIQNFFTNFRINGFHPKKWQRVLETSELLIRTGLYFFE